MGLSFARGTLKLGWWSLLALGPSSCSQTDYDLLAPTSPRDPCVDREGSTEACPLGMGGGVNPAPDPDEAPPETCTSELDPDLETTRLVLEASGQCVGAGAATTLGNDPAYLMEVGTCDGSGAQLWTLMLDETGLLEVRNEMTNFNLDVRFASSEDGTPAILYRAHQLYNQRFLQRPTASGESYRLEARHAADKCLSYRVGRIELWPCDPTADDQLFRTESCQ